MAERDEASLVTREFGHEIELERQSLLRRRFLWYSGTVILLSALSLLFAAGLAAWSAWSEDGDGKMSRDLAWSIPLGIVQVVPYVWAFLHVRRHRATRWPTMKIVSMLIIVSGTLGLLSGGVTAVLTTARTGEPLAATHAEEPNGRPRLSVRVPGAPAVRVEGEGQDSRGDPGTPTGEAEPAGDARLADGILRDSFNREFLRRQRLGRAAVAVASNVANLLSLHFFACLFLPWTPWESMRPMLPLLGLHAVLTLGFAGYAAAASTLASWHWLTLAGILAVSPLVAAPGMLLCWWKSSRLREEVTARLLRGKYHEMRRELVDARRIHESLFPAPGRLGAVELGYAYEPMRQIGGDYLFAYYERPGLHPSERVSIVLLDVTGHGIPAALTVNRIHGELTRLFAEGPWIDPGQVLGLLNRYVHLTLANHSVYVTALCLRVDVANDRLEYASGGHPPAYVRGSDGTLHALASTAVVLGACPDAEFDAAMQSVVFAPGDTLVAYTDGAIESRPRGGRMLGIAGLESLLAGGVDYPGRPGVPGAWARGILAGVDRYRQGPPEDDTLVVEVRRLAAGGPTAREVASRGGSARGASAGVGGGA